jgi:predicted nucleic acid-binding protein
MRLLLDSTFLIDVLDGLPEAVERQRAIFESGDQPLVNEVVICEVRGGMRAEEEPSLVGILEPVEFVQPGPETAMKAGAWREDVRRRGFHLSLADALIAATAFDTDAAVLTRNVRHFTLTPVRVETY